MTGAKKIFSSLNNNMNMLAGERAEERLVHVGAQIPTSY